MGFGMGMADANLKSGQPAGCTVWIIGVGAVLALAVIWIGFSA
jgi:hypothetical protein